MSRKATNSVTTIGIDIGKNSFHVVGLDSEGSMVLRQKLSRGQVTVRFANLPSCLIGMEACVGAHHLSRQLLGLGHDVRMMPARYVKPFLKGQKNDFRDAEAIAEANSVDYGLHAAGFSSDVTTCHRMIEGLDAGSVLINDSTDYRLDSMPFGGVKSSGLGREGIRFSLAEMTEPKVVCWYLPGLRPE